MLGFDSEYTAVEPKAKFWYFLLKHSIEKPILLNFVNLSSTFCPTLYIICESFLFFWSSIFVFLSILHNNITVTISPTIACFLVSLADLFSLTGLVSVGEKMLPNNLGKRLLAYKLERDEFHTLNQSCELGKWRRNNQSINQSINNTLIQLKKYTCQNKYIQAVRKLWTDTN